jgi:hypothetical protein
MEQNVLGLLKGLNGGVKFSPINSSVKIQFDFEVEMKRGKFSQIFGVWASIYESQFKGIICIEEWDIHTVVAVELDGLPIDNFNAFKQKLVDWGFKGISEKLEFTHEERKEAILNVIANDIKLKKIFGKNLKVWGLLPVDELKLLQLKQIVEDYNLFGDHTKNEVAKYYKINEGSTNIPTLDDFQAKLVELAK